MKPPLKTCILGAAAIVAVVASETYLYNLGQNEARKDFQKEAVEAGWAKYDETTGDWRFKTNGEAALQVLLKMHRSEMPKPPPEPVTAPQPEKKKDFILDFPEISPKIVAKNKKV